jgi:PilZ domain
MAVPLREKSYDSATRRAERFSYTEKVEVSVSTGAHLVGYAIDISLSGVAVLLSESVRLDDIVQLRLSLPPTNHPLFVTATVKYCTGKRYGFQFLWLTGEQHKELAEFLRSFALRLEPPKPFMGLSQRKVTLASPSAVSSKFTSVSFWSNLIAFLKAF